MSKAPPLTVAKVETLEAPDNSGELWVRIEFEPPHGFTSVGAKIQITRQTGQKPVILHVMLSPDRAKA